METVVCDLQLLFLVVSPSWWCRDMVGAGQGSLHTPVRHHSSLRASLFISVDRDDVEGTGEMSTWATTIANVLDLALRQIGGMATPENRSGALVWVFLCLQS